MTFVAGIESLPFCCGIMEAGNFEEAPDHWTIETAAENPEDLVTGLLEVAAGRPLIFNFISSSPKELVEYVSKHQNVVSLGSWINPGHDHNRIESYILKDYV